MDAERKRVSVKTKIAAIMKAKMSSWNMGLWRNTTAIISRRAMGRIFGRTLPQKLMTRVTSAIINKLLSLSKTEYLVPKEAQMLSPSLKDFKTDTKAKNECNYYSNSQLHFTALSVKNIIIMRVPWNGNYTTMHEMCLKPTSNENNTIENIFIWDMFTLIMFCL